MTSKVLQMGAGKPHDGMVPISRVRVNPRQPRKHFDEKKLKALVRSIQKNGLIDPIIVCVVDGDPKCDYEVVDGERRYRASLLAGRDKIKVRFHTPSGDLTSKEQRDISIASNTCREPLSHIETARAFAEQRADYDLEEIADRNGCTSAWVSQLLKILELPQEVQDMMESSVAKDDRLTMTIAYYIALRVPRDKPKLAIRIAKKIQKDRMRAGPAKQYIDKASMGLGSEVVRRQPQPARVFEKLENFMSFVAEQSLMWQKIPEGEFTTAMSLRGREEIDPVIQGITNSIERLQEMRKRLVKARERS